ncbi:unnamed protein product [Effrenium voratum]|nr:unnamed protein product [Effrenium voratum]
MLFMAHGRVAPIRFLGLLSGRGSLNQATLKDRLVKPCLPQLRQGSTEGRGSGPISHKKVPRKVNIQEEFAEEGVEITTAMIRNVPNQLNRKQFVERLDQLGFQGLYDFVYVPMDRATRMNVGYAFVNFVRPEIFRLCQSSLQGKKFLDKEDGDKRRSGKPIIAPRPQRFETTCPNLRKGIPLKFKDAVLIWEVLSSC